MEETQKKLAVLDNPRANAPAQSLLELLGDKSPFSQQNLPGDGMDRDEETSRIQWTIDTEAIQERGSYEDRTEMLRLIVDLVEASMHADNPEWRPDVTELDTKLSEQSKILLNLQQKFDDLVSKYAYNPVEDYQEVESQLRAHLESFLETVRTIKTIYTKEIRPWTQLIEVPQLHGFGPAANRLLETYKMLLQHPASLQLSHG